MSCTDFAAVLTLAISLPAQWSTPQLVANVNWSGLDLGARPSADGLSLYFASNRIGSALQIFRATRTAPYGDFGAPVHLAELGSSTFELSPCVRGDELEIYFVSIRAGGLGGFDFWRAERASKAAPFGVPTLAVELDSTGDEWGASLTGDGLRVYFSSNRPGGSGGAEIYTATRPSWSVPFGPPTPVVELNTADNESDPYVSPDGHTVFFVRAPFSNPFGDRDLWMAKRLDTSAPFANLAPVAALNSAAWEEGPGFATFHDEVFFTSNRGGGASDIYRARFTGLLSDGVASIATAQDLRFSDPGSPGLPYIAASSLGSSPGIPIDTRVLPLNLDGILHLTVGGLPPILSGYAGTLDADGIAAGRIVFAGFPRLVGLRFFTAFIVLDATAPSGIKTISNAHEVVVR